MATEKCYRCDGHASCGPYFACKKGLDEYYHADTCPGYAYSETEADKTRENEQKRIFENMCSIKE